MIKMFGLIARRPDITPDEFHAHYRHPHGTLALQCMTGKGYVQSHHIHSDLLGADQATYEAIMELWIESVERIPEMRSEPAAVRYLEPDEPKFIDMSRSGYLATTEDVIDGGGSHGSEADRFWTPESQPNAIKILQFIREDDGAPPDRLRDAGQAIGALRHVFCRSVQLPHEPVLQCAAVRELWWPTLFDFRAGVARAPEAWAQIVQESGPALTLLAVADRFT